MEFRALGPVELWAGGHQHDLGPARARSILAMLLLTPRTIVPAETLIDRLWDTRPPPKARESLSVYVARLRASLRQALGDEVQLSGRARGYVLEVDPDLIDLHRFRRLRRQAGALATSGDDGQAAVLLREADGLWRGQALAGISGDWVGRMRDGLEEERRGAILERIECELALGRHADLVGELRHWLALYPLDETFVAHQMTALYWSGRPADALSLYRSTRDQLIEEQGAEPGPALAELHQRILGRDPGLAVRPADQRPGRAPRPHTLPPDIEGFTGREAELARLTGADGGMPRVAVIEGMPGVGKTALAIRAAHAVAGQYPDGTMFLDLHSHDPAHPALDPAEALQRLLQMMPVPAAQIPDTIGERTTLWRDQLSRRRAIVILDDAAQPDQLHRLLPLTGSSLVLVTSRRKLPDLVGGRTVSLGVLPGPDAVELFRRVAGPDRAADPDEVARAVALCGQLPLAIQLAASRVAARAQRPVRLADLIGELSHVPAQLGGTGAASPGVVAAFDLSYGALEPDHQRFFRRLGAGPCDSVSLHAAAALGGCTLAEAEKALSTLVDQHLLDRIGSDRYQFHRLLRDYAAVRAVRDDQESGRRQAVGRLLDYYLHTADRAGRLVHPVRRTRPLPPDGRGAAPPLGTRQAAAVWLAAEFGSILQSAAYAGRHEWKRQCADLAHVLADYVDIEARWAEAAEAYAVALRACRELADPGLVAQAALELSAVRQQTGQSEAGLSLAEEALALFRSVGDRAGEAAALDQIGVAQLRAAQARAALGYFLEARSLYREAGDERGEAATTSHQGIADWHLGRYTRALEHLTSARETYQRLGDERGEAKALNNLGKVHLYNGSHQEALEAYQRSLAIFTEIGGAQSRAILHHSIGDVHHYKGSYPEALESCRMALEIYRDIGDRPDEAEVLSDIGSIYLSAHCPDEALVNYERARQIAEETGNGSQQVTTLRLIGDVHRTSGWYGEALGQYQAALQLARVLGDLYEEGKALEGIAESWLSTQRPDTARIVFRQALDIFEQLEVPEAEPTRIRIETLDSTPRLRVS